MKPSFWQQKMEKLLHIKDLSLKKESGKHKEKLILKNQKIKLLFVSDKKRGVNPSFFFNL